jgi:uncharacterized protein YceH (UPF0502 family)
MPTLPDLSLLETRVLGVLVEKQHTVPDTLPADAARAHRGLQPEDEPRSDLSASEPDVQAAHRSAASCSRSSSSRAAGASCVTRRTVGRVLEIPAQAVALLAALMLRGPQTAAELRINPIACIALSDTSAAEAFLEELAARQSGALVVLLPRQPGAREARWAHLLSGAADASSAARAVAEESSPVAAPEFRSGDAARPTLRICSEEVAQLKAAVAETLHRARRSRLLTKRARPRASSIMTTKRPSPLEGVTVLDLTNVLAGPFACYQLACLGARVIKVESPDGDLARKLGADPAYARAAMGISFLAVNAGKQSIALDLKHAGGKEVFLRLVERADVLDRKLSSGRDGAARLRQRALARVNPRLVYCAISGFGQTGPFAHAPRTTRSSRAFPAQ